MPKGLEFRLYRADPSIRGRRAAHEMRHLDFPH
jgi:hypothetical protein